VWALALTIARPPRGRGAGPGEICGLPVLVQPLQRGAAEAGIPIGDAGEEQPWQGQPGQHVAPKAELAGVRSEPGKCSLREVDAGVVTTRRPVRTVYQPAPGRGDDSPASFGGNEQRRIGDGQSSRRVGERAEAILRQQQDGGVFRVDRAVRPRRIAHFADRLDDGARCHRFTRRGRVRHRQHGQRAVGAARDEIHQSQGRTDPDDAPEPPAHPVAEPGDLLVLGRHRLLCGDSTVATDVERVLGGVAPQVIDWDVLRLACVGEHQCPCGGATSGRPIEHDWGQEVVGTLVFLVGTLVFLLYQKGRGSRIF
jgi:hypothetical protein